MSDTAAYLVRLVSPEGRVGRTIGTGEAPRRVTPADRERALTRIRADQRARQERERNEQFQNPAALWQKQLDATPFADVVPRVSGVRVGPQGRIWVGVSGDSADVARIDIYDREGKLLRRVMQPPGMPAVLYGDGFAALLVKDDFDAQAVRIMRVSEP